MQNTILPMVSHYSTDPQVAVMNQEMQQCSNKDIDEEHCQLVNMEVKHVGKNLTNRLCKSFMRK